MRADAAKRKVTKWYDGSDDRDLNRRIMISCLLSDIPCVVDYNWWGHSVSGVELVSLNPLTINIKNSWKGWGNNGIVRRSEVGR